MRLPYPPSANRYWRSDRGIVHLSADARAYKKGVSKEAAALGVTPIVGPVKVRINVYRPRRARDLDNCIKVVLDALQGTFYANDSQIVAIHAYRHEDKADPRIEVDVEAYSAVTRPMFEQVGAGAR